MAHRKTRIVFIAISALLVVFISIGAIIGQSDNKDDLYKKFDIFVEVMNRIRNDYVEPVKPETIFDGALKGMANMLDSESSYLTPAENEQYKKDLKVRTAETGISVIKLPSNGNALVIFIRPGSPAAESGVQVGDFIWAVDDSSTRRLPAMLLDLDMKGAEGSIAKLSIFRTGVQGILTYEVPRTHLDPLTVSHEVKNGVGIVRIPTFDIGVLEDTRSAMEDLQRQGIRDVVIDLRGNYKGSLEEAVFTADLFLKEGLVLKLDSKGEPVEYKADAFAFDVDLAVVCDESTARAAEAFAAALKDNKAAKIVGRNTLGLATLQKEIGFEDGALLNISYAKFVGPAGTEILGNGVQPDIQIDQSDDNKSAEDRLLKAAIGSVKN